MFFILIFFYAIFETIIVCVVGSDCNCTPITTEWDKFNNYVLRRRIRALVFPKNAQLLLTPSFTKAVLDGIPKGLLYAMEFDMYNSLPDTLDGWKPTVLVNKLEKQNTLSQSLKIKTTLPNNSKIVYDHRKEEENHLYLKHHDYYNFPWHENLKKSNDLRLKWPIGAKSLIKRKYRKGTFQKQQKLSGFESYFHKQPYLAKTYKRWPNYAQNGSQIFSLHDSSHIKYPRDLHHDTQCNHEREDLLKQFTVLSKILNIDLKKCIRRALCEVTSHFRPYGESVMEDIIRLILIPSPNSQSSKRANYCKQNYELSCPYSVLDFFS